jgi:hypothetical protein
MTCKLLVFPDERRWVLKSWNTLPGYETFTDGIDSRVKT